MIEPYVTNQYDVFLSCKSEDYKNAKVVYDYLHSHDIKVFMADQSLRKEAISNYGEVIDEVLDKVKHIIVFATKLQYLLRNTSPYVYYEWHTFCEELKTGRKNGNLITILSPDITIDSLPIALRNRQSFRIANYKDVLPYVKVLNEKTSQDHSNNFVSLSNKKDSEISFPPELDLSKIPIYKNAIKGDPAAQYQIAICYKNGDGINKSIQHYIKWMQTSANNGFINALLAMTEEYLDGKVVKQSQQKATQYYRKAYSIIENQAENGDVNSQYLLGMLNDRNWSFENAYDVAPQWIMKAAMANHPGALFMMAQYFHGWRGIFSVSMDNYIDYLIKSANKGYAPAQYELGMCYGRPHYVDRSLEKAVYFITTSAESGYRPAQLELAECYRTGKTGFSKDEQKSQYWEKIAEENIEEPNKYRLP